MTTPTTTSSTSRVDAARAGLFALLVYGVAVFASTLTHQPDSRMDFQAYAEYVTTPQFLASHLVGSIAGTVIGIFGVLALYRLLAAAHPRARRLAAGAMATTVSGLALLMTLFGVAAFAQPAIGRAYLSGAEAAVAINGDVYGAAAIAVGVLGGLLYSTGGVLFGRAIWRSSTLPRWSGVAYAAAIPLVSLVGLAIGAAQTVGAVLLIASTVGMLAATRRRAPGTGPAHVATTAGGAA